MKTATKSTTKRTASKSTAVKSSTASKSSSKSTTGRGQVKAKSTAAEGLKELYIDSLKDIYWAEKAFIKSFMAL